MNKCVRVSFDAQIPLDFLRDAVQKMAQSLHLEGIAQAVGSAQKIIIIVSGKKSNIDSFVDYLHQNLTVYGIQIIDVEPYVKIKDYRGVFRIVE